MSEWRDIETAPKDGTPVLIFDHGDIVVAKFNPRWRDTAWTGTYGDGDAYWEPTHWMPLPPPPIQKETEG